jgi:hypothetical protein
MFTTARRTIGFLLVVTTLLSAGCIKAKQNIVFMPDGSGRMDMTLGYSKAMFDQMNQGQQQKDPTDINISEMADQSQGIVAFTRPVREEKDGWVMVRFSAYFDDINDVKMNKNDAEDSPVYTFREDGTGHRVEVTKGMTTNMISEMGEEEVPAEQRQMMLMMFAGFELTESFTMPGTVADATGLPKVDGRTASVTVVDRDLVDRAKLTELGADPRVVVSEASTLSAGELAAFRAEMAQAKAEWAAIKAEAAAAAATQPAE